MKKTLLLLLLAGIFSNYAAAQTGSISCISYKEIWRTNGNWGTWSDYWTTYQSQGRSNPIVRVTVAEQLQSGNVYRVQLLIDGNMAADFYVAYDSDKTATVRSDWNDNYVNCYSDKVGDYVYTQEVSLESLAQDPTNWAKDEKSKMYFWIFSQNHAVVVK